MGGKFMTILILNQIEKPNKPTTLYLPLAVNSQNLNKSESHLNNIEESAKTFELSSDGANSILHTINQLSNIAQRAMAQDIISRHNYLCLIDDIKQIMRLLNHTTTEVAS